MVLDANTGKLCSKHFDHSLGFNSNQNRSRSRSRRSNGELNKQNKPESDSDNEKKKLVIDQNKELLDSTSRRRHRRSTSKSSTNRKSFHDQTSGVNLGIQQKKYGQYEPSETCHETSMDENNIDDLERKRQIRRRKCVELF